jgi:tetratricopeptide (TPR) repeat protein
MSIMIDAVNGSPIAVMAYPIYHHAMSSIQVARQVPMSTPIIDACISRRIPWIVATALFLAATLPYLQTLGFAFIDLDDNTYIFDNRHVLQGLTPPNISWAFTTFQSSNWHPITWISHMIDCNLFRTHEGSQWPGGHHLVNVLLHGVNTLLLLAALRALTKQFWPSALVAALFAIHPLNVESVAWIAQRKTLLSTALGFAALWSHASYSQRQNWKSYGLVVGFFLLSLLSKPMLVTFPFLLLLVDYWPLRRLRLQRPPLVGPADDNRSDKLRFIIAEKLPLLLITLASCVVTYLAQRQGGAVSDLERLALTERIANAVVAYGTYLRQMVWPVRLVVVQPHPGHVPAIHVIMSATVLIFITAIALMFAKRKPWLMAGWLWYLGTLVPVIGLVQVGVQANADRYTYVPLIGIFIMIAWTLGDIVRRHSTRWTGAVAFIAVAIALGSLATRTINQASKWRDTTTLFTHALRFTDRNVTALNALGHAYAKKGNYAEAAELFRQAVEINPESATAQANLGATLSNLGEYSEAAARLLKALDREPNAAWIHNALGQTYFKQGQPEALRQATESFQAAANLDPENALYWLNLGAARLASQQWEEAARALSRGVQIQPNNASAHAQLGAALWNLRRPDQAIVHYKRALQLNPQLAQTHIDLGVALASQGQLNEAILHFQDALRLRPDDVQARQFLEAARQQLEQSK